LLLGSQAVAEEKEYGSIWATVVKVYDGDTLTVNVEKWPPILGENLGVRVFGVDTREMSEGGVVAKEYVKKLIPDGSTICLSHILRDKYFRVVARVGYDCAPVLDEKNPCDSCKDLSRTLLKNKYALPYDGGTKSEFPEDIK
jgi:endonuclease YncB( thermonuclease family)